MDTKDTTKKLPDDVGKQIMEFAQLTTDSYRNGSMQGQLKILRELQIHLQHKIDDIQKQYDQTEVGAIMKKVKDG